MKNEIENKKNTIKPVLGNSFTFHKRKHQELKEKSSHSSIANNSTGFYNSNSLTNSKFGITEKKFKKDENFVKRFLNTDTKPFNTFSCYYSPAKSEFSTIKEINSCRLKEVSNPNIIFENKQLNSFSSEFKKVNEETSHNKEHTTRINNFKKKIKSSEEIILEEMNKFKFTAQPLKKNLFSTSKFKAKSCSQFLRGSKQELENKRNNIHNKKNKQTYEKNRIGVNSISISLRNRNKSENLKNHLLMNHSRSVENKASYLSNLLKNVKINANGSSENEVNKYQTISSNTINDFTTRKKENLIYSDLNFKNVKSNFKARILPNFTFLEVKKSNKSLTVPKSPELKTKERSVSKLKIQK